MQYWPEVWEIVKMPYYFQFSLLFVLVILHAYWIAVLFILALNTIKKKSITVSQHAKRSKIIEQMNEEAKLKTN